MVEFFQVISISFRYLEIFTFVGSRDVVSLQEVFHCLLHIKVIFCALLHQLGYEFVNRLRIHLAIVSGVLRLLINAKEVEEGIECTAIMV
mmetsp:Transcript_39241/g.59868  ORF Transcript_39241/g.59868 Transcript_39241/m.59868 type:complete len:90 (-) Transcript_39241:873-1142(-)